METKVKNLLLMSVVLAFLLVPGLALADMKPGLSSEAVDLGLKPVPGYEFHDGGEIFAKFVVLDVDRTADGVDVGGIHLFQFKPGAPSEMKNFVIQRFTTNNVGINSATAQEVDVDGVTWHYLHHGLVNEWYRYDKNLNAILQYMQPRRIDDEQAKAFLSAFDKSNRVH